MITSKNFPLEASVVFEELSMNGAGIIFLSFEVVYLKESGSGLNYPKVLVGKHKALTVLWIKRTLWIKRGKLYIYSEMYAEK